MFNHLYIYKSRLQKAISETFKNIKREKMLCHLIDSRLADLKAGQNYAYLPESSPSCKECYKYDGMIEAELDVELARLRAILEKADAYGS